MKILVIEPAWQGFAHLPANCGALLALLHAYPEADFYFFGDSMQITEIKKLAPREALQRTRFTSVDVYHDNDTLYSDVRRRRLFLSRILASLPSTPELILLCSCTATTLTCVADLRLAERTAAFLHGNANELAGWRSRNLIRRFFDLHASTRRFVKRGGRLLVYEDRIQAALMRSHPWMAQALRVVPHPLLENEFSSFDKPATREAIRIGFAGLATSAKGFPEFVALAEMAAAKGLNIEFHAIGPLHDQCSHLDQKNLWTKAAGTLERSEYVQRVSSMDFLFAWHQDEFYAAAASGIVYDSINLGIPLLGRSGGLLDNFEGRGIAIGRKFASLEDVAEYLSNPGLILDELQFFRSSLFAVRQNHVAARVAVAFVKAFSSDADLSAASGRAVSER